MNRLNALILIVLAVGGASGRDANSQQFPSSGLLAHFGFNGNGKDDTGINADFELKNTEFIDNSLFLNGIYEHGPKGGYRAVGSTPKMSYQTFSIVVRFKLATPREGASQPNLITGGTSHRWFGLRFSDTVGGKLIVYLNNGDHAQRVEGTIVRVNTWTVVVCTVDLALRRIVIYQDGKIAGTIDLPKDFVTDVLSNDPKGQDKVWSFTNYSNADTFHGWIDDFALYDRVLLADEVSKLKVGP
jgi:hypothetical protein